MNLRTMLFSTENNYIVFYFITIPTSELLEESTDFLLRRFPVVCTDIDVLSVTGNGQSHGLQDPQVKRGNPHYLQPLQLRQMLERLWVQSFYLIKVQISREVF